jgi:hypothetical protein
MGYDISQEQHDKLERNRREDRLCAVATGRGGCFNRATVKATEEAWVYEEDRLAGEPPVIRTMKLCTRHAKPEAGYLEGTNYRVISLEKF